MTISTGDTLPDATLIELGADGPAEVTVSGLTAGRKVVIFGVPGAFTPTCSSAHLPSFMRTAKEFSAKGVDEIVCVSVNDAFVMQAWGEATGATAAGIRLLADPTGAFAKALDIAFDGPPVGLYGRFRRFSLLAEDGKVTKLHLEESPGVCEVTAGESLLSEMA